MIKKTISLIIIISYIMTCNGPCYGFGARTLFKHRSHAQRHLEKVDDYKDIISTPSFLSIPQNLGQIVEYHKGKSDTLIIHIQDRHIDPITQNNITSIIEMLNQQYSIHLMCLEGASEELDTSFYDGFEDTPLKERIARSFVEKGLFTGAEFYKIANRANYLRAIGAEDKDIYLEHLASYKKNQICKSEVLNLLQGLHMAADNLRDRVYSKDLKALDSISRAYLSNKINFSEYISKLKRYAKRSDTEIGAFQNLEKFIQLTEREKAIDFESASREREALIKYLSENLKKEQAGELIRLSLDLRLNKLSEIAFYDYLERLIADFELQLTDYKNLTTYIDYIRFSKSINHLKVFDEAEEFEEKAQLTLCSNPVQRQLVGYSKSIRMLRDLYDLKLTHRHLDYIDKNPELFDILKIQWFIKDVSARYGLRTARSVMSVVLDRKAIAESRKFYRLALERDIALTENTLKNMKQYHKDKAILIAGGFHTQGITNILKEKDVSFVVIRPTIGLSDCEQTYEDRMAGKLPSEEEIVASLKSMLSAPLSTGDIADKDLARDIQEHFKVVLDTASGAGLSEEKQLTKASSAGIGSYIAKGFVIAAAAGMLGTGFYFHKASMRSQNATMEAILTAQELPSDQWQMILNALREFYGLIEDVDAPQPRSIEMRIKIGKTTHIIRDHIMSNLDSIYKYSLEQKIDPHYIAAIILTEQMDLRNVDTDKLLPFIGWDSSRGPGQITERAFRKHCANMRWPYYGDKLTEELSPSQIDDILNGERDNVDSHIRAIVAIVKGIRKSIKDDLEVAQAYTSSHRGPVPAWKEGLFTYQQLEESENARTWLYAHDVVINIELIRKLLTHHKYKYMPDKFSMAPSIDSAKETQVKASSAGKINDLPASSFYKFVPTTIQPGQMYDYTNPNDRKKMMESLARNNWYYQTSTESERNIMIDKAFNTLSNTAMDQIKQLIVDYMAEGSYQLEEESILSIMLFGSWIYNFKENYSPRDIDLAVIIEGDMPAKAFQKIKIPNTLFKERTVSVDNASLRIIGTKQLLSRLNEKRRNITHFETSMQGHGILLWGRDFFEDEPVMHNLMMMARTLLVTAASYLYKEADSIYYPEGFLDIMEYRLDEVHRIFKVIFSNFKEPEDPLKEQGLTPVSTAVMHMKSTISDMRQLIDAYPYDKFQDILETRIMRYWNSLYQQTETGFMEESLEGLVKEKQRIESTKASSGGQQNLDIKALEKIVQTIVKDMKKFQDYGTVLNGGCFTNNGLLGWLLGNIISKNVKLIVKYKKNDKYQHLLDEHWYLLIDNNIIVDIDPLPEHIGGIQGDILVKPLKEASNISSWYDVDPGEEVDKTALEYADAYIKNIVERYTILKDWVPVLAEKWGELLESEGYSKEMPARVSEAGSDSNIASSITPTTDVDNKHTKLAEAVTASVEIDVPITSKASSSGRTINVGPGESLKLPARSPDKLWAALGVCLAVAAHNQKTGEGSLSHFLPVAPIEQLPHVVEWRQNYMDSLIGDIKGDEWNVVVIGSDIDLDAFSDNRKIMLEDLIDYLEKNDIKDLNIHTPIAEKIVFLDSTGKVTIKLLERGGMQHTIDLGIQKSSSAGTITAADVKGKIVSKDVQKRDIDIALKWLNRQRMAELEYIIEELDNPNTLLSEDARLNMADILAAFIIRKANEGADHILPIDMPAKASSGGTKVLSEELRADTNEAVDYYIAPLHNPLSHLGLGRITLITNARTFTEEDKKHLRKLAVQNRGLSDNDPKKITIVAVYDQAKALLKDCGFTDKGNRPSVLGIADFNYLTDSRWQDIAQGEQIAMAAASIRGQNRAVITITDENIARGIASAIPQYLKDRKKGKIVIASMQGAVHKTKIGNDVIEEDEIMFSMVLANAVKETEIQLRENTDQQLFILETLPPIDSKAFEKFIKALTNIKTAMEATASAA